MRATVLCVLLAVAAMSAQLPAGSARPVAAGWPLEQLTALEASCDGCFDPVAAVEVALLHLALRLFGSDRTIIGECGSSLLPSTPAVKLLLKLAASSRSFHRIGHQAFLLLFMVQVRAADQLGGLALHCIPAGAALAPGTAWKIIYCCKQGSQDLL